MKDQKRERGRTGLLSAVNAHPYLCLTLLMLLTGLYVYRGIFLHGLAYVFYGSGSDTVQQYIGSMLNVVYKLRNGDFSLWEFNIGFGLDLLNNQGHIMDPFNIPFYLLGVLRMDRAMYASLAVMQLLKCCMTGWFVMRFLDCFSLRSEAKVLAAYCCSFCGFIMLWGTHYFFATACVFVSLIFWLLERSIRKARFSLGLTAAVAACLLFSIYISYMIALACALYLVIRLFILRTEKGPEAKTAPEVLRILGRTVLSVVSAALMAAVIVLPVYYQFTQVSSRLSGSASIFQRIREQGLLYGKDQDNWILLRMLSNNFLGTELNYQGPVSYIEHIQLFFSLLTLPALILFFAEGIGYSRRKKTYAAGAVLTAFLLFSPVTALLFNKGVNLATRYAFIFIPFAAFILASVLDRIDGFHVGSLLAAWVLLTVGFTYFFRHRVAMDVFHLYRHFVLTLAGALLFLAMVTALSLWKRKRDGSGLREQKRDALALRAQGQTGHLRELALLVTACMVLVNVMTDAYITVNATGIATLDDMVTQNGRLMWSQAGLDYVRDAGESVVRTDKTFSDKMLWNEPQGQDYPGVSYYNTTYNKNVVQFIHKVWPGIMYLEGLGHNYVVFRNDYRNSRMAALMNVRYIMSTAGPTLNHPDYRLVSDRGVYVYENELAGGLGILFDRFTTEDALKDMEPAERQTVMQDCLVLEEIPEELETDSAGNSEAGASGADAGSAENGGEAEDSVDTNESGEKAADSVNVNESGSRTYYRDHGVDFYRDGDDGHLYADVNADGRQMLFVSVPLDAGWTAAVDGETVPVTRADYGFQAIQVPAGESHVTLTYHTPLLRKGAAISAVGILLFVVECVLSRRKRKKESGQSA